MHKARIVELSKLMNLTIHHQTPVSTINMNDIILAEGVARGTALIQRLARKQSVPKSPVPPKKQDDYSNDVINGSIRSYGALTGNLTRDKILMDWLVKEYRKAL